MRSLRPLLAWLLVALWLPATMHCGLEAAEWVVGGCASEKAEHGCGSSDGCRNDVCASVEGGDYRVDGRELDPAPTVILVDAGHLCRELFTESVASLVAPPADPGEPARDWLGEWVFERRAAAPAHAPDDHRV